LKDIVNRIGGRLLATAATLVAAAAHAQDAPPAAELQSAGPDQEPNFQVNSTLSGTRYALSYSPGGPDTSGNREALSMEMIAFGAPLHDDDSPYSLQAFMQRENRFTLSVNGGRLDTANPYGGVDRTEWFTGVGGAFDAYLKPWFAVFGGASYEYFDLHDVNAAQTIHSFGADVGVGFRVRNTRLDLSAAEQGDRTSGAFGAWRGSLTLSAFTVIKRRVALNAVGTLVKAGESGSFEVEVFPTKSAGVFVSGFAGRFQPYVTPTVVTRYAGTAGFAGWFDANTALVGTYELTYETDPATPPSTTGYNDLSHTFALEARLRFP
jgi:hypothetical protein